MPSPDAYDAPQQDRRAGDDLVPIRLHKQGFLTDQFAGTGHADDAALAGDGQALEAHKVGDEVGRSAQLAQRVEGLLGLEAQGRKVVAVLGQPVVDRFLPVRSRPVRLSP